MLIYVGIAEPLYALSLFTPTIVANLGRWTRPQSMLLSTPPFFLAFIVTLLSALYSDRIGHRGMFNVFWMSFVVIGQSGSNPVPQTHSHRETRAGFGILLGVDPREHPGVSYFALFLCVMGVSPCISNTSKLMDTFP